MVQQEVSDFYDKHFGGIGGFITSARRRALDPQHVRIALQTVYDTHHNGKPYASMTQLGQQVLAEASKLARFHAETEVQLLDRLQKQIWHLQNNTLKERLRRLFEGAVWL